VAWPGLRQVNTHIDLIDWRDGGRFIGAELATERIIAHLVAKRLGVIEQHEPTGILTHHKAHDGELSEFLPKLIAALSAHRKVEWVRPF